MTREKKQQKNDKKMGGLVRASLGEKSEGLVTFLGLILLPANHARNLFSRH
jgi:hypothetical protein